MLVGPLPGKMLLTGKILQAAVRRHSVAEIRRENFMIIKKGLVVVQSHPRAWEVFVHLAKL